MHVAAGKHDLKFEVWRLLSIELLEIAVEWFYDITKILK